MLLFYFGTHAYLFSPEEWSCYIFTTRNNCCQFLPSYGVIIQSVTQIFLKTSVCGASLTYFTASEVKYVFHTLKLINQPSFFQDICQTYKIKSIFIILLIQILFVTPLANRRGKNE